MMGFVYTCFSVFYCILYWSVLNIVRTVCCIVYRYGSLGFEASRELQSK
jgi:hypothetical protein